MTTSDDSGQRLSGRERKQAPTAKPLHDLTGFQRDLLRTIAALGETSGSAIRERLKADYGEDITHGQLYQNLTQLGDKGLVEKGQYEIDRRTNSYALTEEGARARDAHLEWELEADGGVA